MARIHDNVSGSTCLPVDSCFSDITTSTIKNQFGMLVKYKANIIIWYKNNNDIKQSSSLCSLLLCLAIMKMGLIFDITQICNYHYILIIQKCPQSNIVKCLSTWVRHIVYILSVDPSQTIVFWGRHIVYILSVGPSQTIVFWGRHIVYILSVGPSQTIVFASHTF